MPCVTRPCVRRWRTYGIRVESDIGTESNKASEVSVRFAEQAANEGVLLEGRRQTVRRVRILEQKTVIPVKDRAGKP